MSGQFESTLQISPLLKKVEFLGVQNAPFGRPWRPNVILCDNNFTPIICFITLHIFYDKMATSEGAEEGGEGLHILTFDSDNEPFEVF